MKRLLFAARVLWLRHRITRLRKRADRDVQTIGHLRTATRHLVAEHIAMTSKRGSLS